MSFNYNDLTPQQLVYLQRQVQSLGLRDRIFTNPQLFDELPLAKRQQLFADLSRPQTQQNIDTWIKQNNWAKTPAQTAPLPPSPLPNAQTAGEVTKQEEKIAKESSDPNPTSEGESTEAVTTAAETTGQSEAANNSDSSPNKNNADEYNATTDNSAAQYETAKGETNNYNPLGNSADQNKGASATTSLENQKQKVNINPLHDYESYTYGLSLHTIDIKNFNAIIENPNIVYRPIANVNGALKGTVLIASAGRKNDQTFQRNDAWTEDFFFENFRMSTLINTTERNRSSNLVECNFTIIEPIGFTLLDRLIAAVQQVGGKNYLLHPYILQVDFFGYKDGAVGSSPIKGLSKIIPIKIIKIKSKISQRGVEYNIDAVPFNHQAFNEIFVVSPANFTVKAKTVQDVFGTGENNSIRLIDDAYEIRSQNDREINRLPPSVNARVRSASSAIDDSREINRAQTIATSTRNNTSTLSDVPKPTYPVSGFCDGYNSFYNNLVNNRAFKYTNKQVTKISVKFHEDIANKNLINTSGPQTVSQSAPATNPATEIKTAAQQSGGAAKNQLAFDGSILNIPANTKIDQLIEWVFRNSEYYREKNDKYNTESTTAKNGLTKSQLKSPLYWYKIIPQMKITGYDERSERYTVEIVYFVKPYLKTTNFPFAPLGRQPGWVKEYNWIYTGGINKITGEPLSNRDVIDLQIEFNMLFFNAVSVFKSKENISETAGPINDPILNYTDDDTQAKPIPPDVLGESQDIQWSNVTPVSTKFISTDPRRVPRTGYDAAAAVNAGDVANSLMTSSAGDMVHVRLKILGDPQFIKQDDIFYGQNDDIQLDQFTPNGSLWMDNGELYVFVNFESPVDYDESTGLARPVRTKYSSFSGVYKVVRIENTFSRGKFTQDLDLVRLLIDDNLRNLETQSTQRQELYKDQQLGQLAPAVPTRFSGSVTDLARVGQINIPNVNQLLQQAQAVAGGAINQLTTAATQTLLNSVRRVADQGTDIVKQGLRNLRGTIAGSNTLTAEVDAASWGDEDQQAQTAYEQRQLSDSSQETPNGDWNAGETSLDTDDIVPNLPVTEIQDADLDYFRQIDR